jgi:hypothetical protein
LCECTSLLYPLQHPLFPDFYYTEGLNKSQYAARRIVATASTYEPASKGGATREDVHNLLGIGKNLVAHVRKEMSTISGDESDAGVMSDPITTALHRETRCDKFSEEKREEIRQFWIANSTPTANKRDQLRHKKNQGGTGEYNQKRVVSVPYYELLGKFCNEKCMVGKDSFYKLRPYYVVPATNDDRRTCLCKYHCQCEMVFRSVAQ